MSKSNQYFNENQVRELLINYYNTDDNKILIILVENIRNIIMGMINRCFSYNTYIKNNYEDIVQECLLHILIALKNKKINLAKGKIFSYFNRLIKNRVLVKSNEIKEYETNFLNFTKLSTHTEVDKDNNDCQTSLLEIIDNNNEDYTRYIKNNNKYKIDNDLESLTLIYVFLKNILKFIKYSNNEKCYDILKYDNEMMENIDFFYYTEILNDLFFIIKNIVDEFEKRSSYFINLNKDIYYYLSNKNYKVPKKLLRNILKSSKNLKKRNKSVSSYYINLVYLIWKNFVEKSKFSILDPVFN